MVGQRKGRIARQPTGTLRIDLAPVLMLVSPVAYAIIALIVALPTLVIFARLGICLPGIAIGRPMMLSESWRLTDGNTVQLCAGALLIYLPFHVVGLALSGQQTNAAAGWVLLLACVFSYIAGISFLSFTYRFFVDAPEQAQPQSSSDGAAGT